MIDFLSPTARAKGHAHRAPAQRADLFGVYNRVASGD